MLLLSTDSAQPEVGFGSGDQVIKDERSGAKRRWRMRRGDWEAAPELVDHADRFPPRREVRQGGGAGAGPPRNDRARSVAVPLRKTRSVSEAAVVLREMAVEGLTSPIVFEVPPSVLGMK